MAMLQRLDAYIAKQLLTFLALTLTVITLVVFFSDTLFDVLKEMQALGLPWGWCVYLLGLQLPSTLAWALLPAMGISVFATYSQLNQHFELVALRVQGVSLGRLVRPALLISSLVALIGLTLFQVVLPWCHQQTTLVQQEWGSLSKLKLKRDGLVLPLYDADQLSSLVYVAKADGKHLQGLSFLDTHQADKLTLLQAQTGEQLTSGAWQLQNVTLLSWNRAKQEFVSNHMNQLQRRELLGRVTPETETTSSQKLSIEGLSFTQGVAHVQQYLAALAQQTPTPSVAMKPLLKLWDRWFQPLATVVLSLLAFVAALEAPRHGKGQGVWWLLASIFTVYLFKSLTVLGVLSGAGTVYPLTWAIWMVGGALGLLLLSLTGLASVGMFKKSL